MASDDDEAIIASLFGFKILDEPVRPPRPRSAEPAISSGCYHEKHKLCRFNDGIMLNGERCECWCHAIPDGPQCAPCWGLGETIVDHVWKPCPACRGTGLVTAVQ